jgi:hypothetical protein
MNTSGHRAAPYLVIVGKLLVAISEFSVVPNPEGK